MTVIELDLETDHVVPERSGHRQPVAMAVAVLLALSIVADERSPILAGAQQMPLRVPLVASETVVPRR